MVQRGEEKVWKQGKIPRFSSNSEQSSTSLATIPVQGAQTPASVLNWAGEEPTTRPSSSSSPIITGKKKERKKEEEESSFHQLWLHQTDPGTTHSCWSDPAETRSVGILGSAHATWKVAPLTCTCCTRARMHARQLDVQKEIQTG